MNGSSDASVDARVLVVVPTYNEAENVAALTEAVLDVSGAIEMLFVDDNSPDGTGKILDGIAAGNDRVHVMHRERKSGLGRAYVAGFGWALERDYELVFEMDADFSHRPADIEGLLGAVEDADLALGSRYMGGTRVLNWPVWRLALSRGAAVYVKMITGLPVSDPTGGFRCYRRQVLEAIDLGGIRSDGYSFQIEMAHQAWMQGFYLVDHPIIFDERRAGSSKMSWAIFFEAIWVVGALLVRSGFRRRPRGPHPEASRAS